MMDKIVGRSIVLAVLAIVVLVLAGMTSGCAMAPQFMQPTHPETQELEAGWLAVDVVDTLQTVQIAKHRQCFVETDPIAVKLYGSNRPKVGPVIAVNLIMAGVHDATASWLDREVDRHLAADNANPGLDSVGPWYSARAVFYAVSLLYSGYSVMDNSFRGIRPWGANCQ